MSLAVVHRPRKLVDLRGQNHVTAILRAMLERWGREEIVLPSGLMLAGTFGSGKTTSARILAAAVNCTSPEEGEPCGNCVFCRAVFNGTSDAVVEVDGATSGGVDSIRGLQAAARLTHTGRTRVIIVDECHAISREGFSALLKQLEEPPTNVLYILVTTDIHSVPDTITSRCLVFSFTSISEEAITTRLHDIAVAERYIYEAEILPAIARRSKGSLRKAIMLLEQLDLSGKMSVAQIEEIWPDTSELFARRFLSTAGQGEIQDGMASIHEAFSMTPDSWALYDAVARLLRDRQVEAFVKTGTGRRDVADLLQTVWEYRLGMRNASPADPTPVEGLWFAFYNKLSGAKTAASGRGLGTAAAASVLRSVASPERAVMALDSERGAAGGERASLAGLADL